METASLAATNAPATLIAAFPDLRPGFLFFSRNRILASWGRGRGSCTPRRPQSRRYSPEPLGTSDGSGRGLAANRDPRGLEGSGPRGRGHVAGTSAPLAVASEHLSGQPQRMRAARRGRARRGTGQRGAEPGRAAPSAGLSRRGPRARVRAPRGAPHPAARPRTRPAPRGARQPGRRRRPRRRRVLPRARSSGRPAALSIVLRLPPGGGWPGRVGGVSLVPGRAYQSVGPEVRERRGLGHGARGLQGA